MTKQFFLIWFVGLGVLLVASTVWPTYVIVILSLLFSGVFSLYIYHTYHKQCETEKKQHEYEIESLEKLHQLKTQQLQTLMIHIPSPLALIDIQGDFLVVNDNFRRICASEQPENYQSTSIPLDIRNFIRESYLNESSTFKIIRHQNTDFQALSIPISQSNRYGGTLILLQDITTALERERMQKRFITDASHELKTPISAIKGMIEILNRPEFDDEETLKEFLGQIQQEASRLQSLVEDLLMMSKINANKILLDFQPVDVTAIVSQAASSIKPLLQAKGIVYAGPTKAVRTIFADGNQLIQVFTNLLVNALQYTESGEVRVVIDEDNHDYIIRIKDSGLGISNDDLPYIFERFYRSSSDRSRLKGGSGLGLAIVKSLVEAHQGKIKVHSELSVGSTFSVHLPKINTTLTKGSSNL